MSNENNSCIPRLRFPGFEGEWEEKKLGEVATFKRGMTITAKDTKNGDVPVIAGGQTPSYYHNVSNREGETIAISGSGAYAGFVSFWNTPVFLSDSFSVETELDINKKYAFYFLKHKQQDLFFMQKGAGVPHVHGTDVGNIIIPLPSFPEQQKIASCLSELDNLIAAQGQKVDALKEKKKGLMQQLFPQPGETTPRLRFPGFEGEWVEKKLGDLYRKNNVKNDLSFGTDKIISVANMYYKTDANIGDKDYLRTYNIFRLGDIAYEGNKSANYAYGRFVENTIGDGIVSHVFDVYSPISSMHCIDYWKYAINYERIMRPILEKSTIKSTMMTNLIAKDFLKQHILVPSLTEQQKIASCLSSLDGLIAAESAKVEALKDHKKGLMQQLFPQPAK